jgi:hypothetical protein
VHPYKEGERWNRSKRGFLRNKRERSWKRRRKDVAI